MRYNTYEYYYLLHKRTELNTSDGARRVRGLKIVYAPSPRRKSRQREGRRLLVDA